jgi:LmbE family N-acetylglucosaminyl deacetylase
VQHVPGAPIVVLSPHLDDAVLSAWSVISDDRDVAVVNVFAGVPEPRPVPRWDRMAGADDCRSHMQARLAEDRDALALAGRQAIYLPFLDEQYRKADPGRDALAEALSDAHPAASVLYAPAGIGGHADHLLVRDVAFDLSNRARLPLHLYAELPYAARFGWPSWVTGTRANPRVVVDADWELSLERAPVSRSALSSRVRRLDQEESSAKLAAMKLYRTQFPLLNQGPIGLLENRLVLPWEVGWSVARDGV